MLSLIEVSFLSNFGGSLNVSILPARHFLPGPKQQNIRMSLRKERNVKENPVARTDLSWEKVSKNMKIAPLRDPSVQELSSRY